MCLSCSNILSDCRLGDTIYNWPLKHLLWQFQEVVQCNFGITGLFNSTVCQIVELHLCLMLVFVVYCLLFVVFVGILLFLSLSLSLPVGGGSPPDPLQEVPQASRIALVVEVGS